MTSILVIDDDPIVRNVLIGDLLEEGFDVQGVADAAAMWAFLSSSAVDLVLLDLGLPDVDGLVVATELRRKHPHTAIIMITARDGLADRISGLRLGADAYVVKPFHFGEVSAVIDSVLRRTHISAVSAAADKPQTTGNEWILDYANWTLTPPGPSSTKIKLSTNEFYFLQVMAASPKQHASRTQLIQSVCANPDNYDQRNLDAILRRLRIKISTAIGAPAPIQVIHAKGYIFTAPLLRLNLSE